MSKATAQPVIFAKPSPPPCSPSDFAVAVRGGVPDHEREAVGAGAAADRDREFVGEVARVDLGRPERAARLVGGGGREHEVRRFEFGGAVELPAAGAGVGDHRDAFFFGRRVGVCEGDGVGARGEREGGHRDLAAGGGDFGCGGAVDGDGGLPAGAGGCGLSDRAARALDRAREGGRRRSRRCRARRS